MKKASCQIVVIILLTVFLLSCGQIFGAPHWVEQKPQRPDLLQGIGIAQSTDSPEEDRRRADDNAITEIINQIRITVNSAVESYYHEEIENDEIVLSSDVFTKISSQYAHETIEGIQIADRFYDNNLDVYYSYAFITRVQLDKQFKEKADNVVKLCADYHHYARQSLRENNVYAALGNYIKALGELFVAQAYSKKKINGDLDNSGRSEMLQVRLESELSSIVGDLSIQTISGDEQRAQRNRPLSQPLTGKVIYKNTQPVSNFPVTVKFTNATGDLSSDVITNQSGEFTSYVNLVKSAETEVGIIRAGLNLVELEPFRGELNGIFKRLEQFGCDFKFQIDVAASVRIFVSIYEEVDGKTMSNPHATGSLIGALVMNKFTVIETDRLPSSAVNIDQAVQAGDDDAIVNAVKNIADYAVVGVVIAKTSKNAGTGYGLFFAFADADVRVINLRTGQILVSSIQSRVKSGGGDEVNSSEKAIAKCSKKINNDIIKGLKEALK